MEEKLKKISMILLTVILAFFLTSNYSRSLSIILLIIGGMNIYKNKSYKFKGIEKYVLVYFAVQLLSLFFCVDLHRSLKEYYRHLYMLIPLFTVSQIPFKFKEKIKILDISTGIVTLYYLIYINLQKYNLIKRLPGNYIRYRGFGDDGTIVKYAFIVGVITLYYWFRILEKKDIKKSFIEIFMLLGNIYLIILSGTRGAWLGIIGAMIVMTILNSDNLINGIKRSLLGLGIFIGTNFILFKLGMFKYFEKRILSIGNVVSDKSNTARLEMWGIAYEYFKKRKLIGYGYRPDLWYKVSFGSKFDHPHNDYFQILVGSGILGIISYFYMMFGLLYRGIKNIKEDLWLYVVGIIIFILVYGLFETLIQLSIGINIFIFILSLV